jgi:hypothetical protein
LEQQLSRLDSFTNQTQRLLEDHQAQNARVLFASTTDMAIASIYAVADSLSPERMQFRQGFFERVQQKLDPTQIVVRALCLLAEDQGISTVDMNIVADALGSLVVITTVTPQVLDQIPVERATKHKLLKFFQSLNIEPEEPEPVMPGEVFLDSATTQPWDKIVESTEASPEFQFQAPPQHQHEQVFQTPRPPAHRPMYPPPPSSLANPHHPMYQGPVHYLAGPYTAEPKGNVFMHYHPQNQPQLRAVANYGLAHHAPSGPPSSMQQHPYPPHPSYAGHGHAPPFQSYTSHPPPPHMYHPNQQQHPIHMQPPPHSMPPAYHAVNNGRHGRGNAWQG